MMTSVKGRCRGYGTYDLETEQRVPRVSFHRGGSRRRCRISLMGGERDIAAYVIAETVGSDVGTDTNHARVARE